MARTLPILLALLLCGCPPSDKPGDSDTPDEPEHTGDTDGDADTDADADSDTDTDVPQDADGDGWTSDQDCHDDDATAYPGSHEPEVPGDGVDQDCDGLDACRDLNCDGWPDIVFAQTDADENYHTDSLIYLGSADGYSGDATWTVPTVGAMGADAGDFDQDGYVDLVFASVQDGENREIDSYVYYGGADGFSEKRRAALPTIGCSDPTASDLDQDGWIDLIFSNRFSGGTPSVDTYSNDSYVYWGGPEGYSTDNRLGLPTIGAARSEVADINRDGRNDVVFANGVTEFFFVNESYVYWGTDEGWGEHSRTELTSVFPEGLAVGDMNGDDNIDVFFTSWMCVLYCGDANNIYWGDLAGNLGDDYFQLPEATGGTDAQLADLDDDGWMDIVLSNGGVEWDISFADTSYVYWGGATGFSEERRSLFDTTAASESAVRDLDGDGWLDIVFASHYEPSDGSPEVSQIYWGSSSGFDSNLLTELPTTHAAGLVVVGSIYP